MAKRRTRLEQLGLIKTTVPAATHEIMKKRIDAVHRLHIGYGSRLALGNIEQSVESFGIDCYLQGLVDGAGAGARDPSIVSGNA